jgi:hypothetical protein
MQLLKYDVFKSMSLIFSSALQSNLVRACAIKFLPFIVMQRVVMNWRSQAGLGFTAGSTTTPR